MLKGKCLRGIDPAEDMSEPSSSGAEHSGRDEVAQEQPRRTREQILREFKLALAIGDGSLLEVDQDRARGFDPYDNSLGGRRGGRGPGIGGGSGGPGGPGPGIGQGTAAGPEPLGRGGRGWPRR